MIDQMQYRVEHTGETATLFVYGSLEDASVSPLLLACESLPPSVRTLRLDLRDIGVMSAGATNAVRRILQQWRITRLGEFRLSTMHMVATCKSTVAPTLVNGPVTAMSDSMTAAYL